MPKDSLLPFVEDITFWRDGETETHHVIYLPSLTQGGKVERIRALRVGEDGKEVGPPMFGASLGRLRQGVHKQYQGRRANLPAPGVK